MSAVILENGGNMLENVHDYITNTFRKMISKINVIREKGLGP